MTDHLARGLAPAERDRLDDLAVALAAALRPLVRELVREELAQAAQPRVEWLTVEQYAERRHTTPSAILKRLERGTIQGATKDGGRAWLIPDYPAGQEPTTIRPSMKRAPRRR